MNLLISVYFFIIATIQAGLFLTTYHYARSRNSVSPDVHWMISLAASWSALFIFGLGVLFVQEFTRPQMSFTLANTLFYVGTLYQGLFCKSLNQPLKPIQKRLAMTSVVFFLFGFEWLRRHVDFEGRTMFMCMVFFIILIWQIIEVQKRYRLVGSPQLRYLQFASGAEVIFVLCRLVILILATQPIKRFENIPEMLILFTIAQLVANTMSYVAISGYWMEKISEKYFKSNLENQEIKALLSERENLINSLLRANRTVATGALSASIAHELNQPIGAISNNLFTLGMLLDRQEIHDHDIKKILVDLTSDNLRTADIVKSLRAIFKDSRNVNEMVDLRISIDGAVKIVQHECRLKGIVLETNIQGDLTGKCNPIEIQQVLLNLINNAIQSLIGSGVAHPKITISAMREGDWIHCAVADNGPGVSEEFAPKLFQLLMSNRDSGMGLGLWLSRYIVEQYGGQITYDGAPGVGADFRFSLPVDPSNHKISI